MINNTYVCINGEYYDEVKNLNGVPTQGKKITVNGDPLPIRVALRYIDPENDITNLYIDLIREDKKQ